MQHPTGTFRPSRVALADLAPTTTRHPAYCSPAACTAHRPGGVHRSNPAELTNGARIANVSDDQGAAGIELSGPGFYRVWWPTTRREERAAWRSILAHVRGGAR